MLLIQIHYHFCARTNNKGKGRVKMYNLKIKNKMKPDKKLIVSL